MSVRISDSTLKIFNPATGEDISSISITTSPQLQTILQSAKDAAETYNFSNLFHRQKLIKNFRRGILKNMDEFIETMQ